MCFSFQTPPDLETIAQLFPGKIDLQLEIPLAEAATYLPLKVPASDQRVYPNFLAPVLKITNGEKTWHSMRYRLRPANSTQEIPTRFNVYNARLENLLERPTWQALLGRQHALVPMGRFYEWVINSQGKKELVAFTSQDGEWTWALGLWDYWRPTSNQSVGIYSFAIITTVAPPEIMQAGHHRCPLCLPLAQVGDWPTPRSRPPAEWRAFLSSVKSTICWTRTQL